MPEPLRALIATELSISVDPRVSAMAQAIAAQHGAASLGVLFYGSCLRQDELKGLMLDFYLIVSSYSEAYDKRWLAVANALVPPNVFYFEREGLVAKYAVLSAHDFARECGTGAQSTSVMARFAQPSRLVWSSGEDARTQIVEAIGHCAPTLLAHTVPLAPNETLEAIWKRAFGLTFAAEIRAERADRSAAIVDSDPDRYQRFGEAAAGTMTALPDRRSALRWWSRMKRRGKLLSVVRLAKASGTFAGGADYIAWKINRHAGTAIALSPWQRRHPLLAAITLLPQLLKSGAIR
jgi:hypothetical protein